MNKRKDKWQYLTKYEEIKKHGYIPIKEYERYILFQNENGHKTTLHKAEFNKKALIKIIDKLRGTND